MERGVSGFVLQFGIVGVRYIRLKKRYFYDLI
jgi:hypothetical protein